MKVFINKKIKLIFKRNCE